MSTTDTINLSHLMRELRDEMLDTDTGVSVRSLHAEFRGRYDYLKDEPADAWWDRHVRSLAATVITPNRSQQLSLPGLGDIPNTITTFDGEGGHVHKRLTRATRQDLLNDQHIQQINAESAKKAYELALQRNDTLIAVMDEQGFATAGEAVDFLREMQDAQVADL
jgi:hypothetical protein